MNEEEKEFLQHIWNVLGYDTSEGAPPIHEQFNQRYKHIIQRAQPQITHREKMKTMTDEERRAYFRQKNRESIQRRKRKNL